MTAFDFLDRHAAGSGSLLALVILASLVAFAIRSFPKD